jgi:hypothetical protein
MSRTTSLKTQNCKKILGTLQLRGAFLRNNNDASC